MNLDRELDKRDSESEEVTAVVVDAVLTTGARLLASRASANKRKYLVNADQVIIVPNADLQLQITQPQEGMSEPVHTGSKVPKETANKITLVRNRTPRHPSPPASNIKKNGNNNIEERFTRPVYHSREHSAKRNGHPPILQASSSMSRPQHLIAVQLQAVKQTQTRNCCHCP